MTKIALKAKFIKMSSVKIFSKAMAGKLTERQARAAAEVIERRFPTPAGI